MSKLIYNLINRMLTNAKEPSSPTSGSRGAINRDPKQVQAKRVGYQISSGSADEPESPEIDFDAIENAIGTDSYLKQGTLRYKELIFKSGWSLQSKNEQAMEYLKYRMDMIQVATGMSIEDLFQGISSDLVDFSNVFIAKARAKNGVGLPPGLSLTPVLPSKEPVAGYFLLPPKTISITRDENGTVTGYTQEVDGGGDALEFKPEDIIHIKTNAKSGAAFGDPWISPVIEDIRLLRKIEENVSLLLYKHIFPVLKYKVGTEKEGEEASDDEIEEVQALVDNMDNDSIFVMPHRHDVDALNINAIDGKPYLDYFENRVFSGMGLSQVDFGRGDTANRNTADAMGGNKADRIKGWQKTIQSSIDLQIINELLIEGGFDPLVNPEFDVDFVFNEIEQERLIAKNNHEIHKFNNNLQTFEETRTAMGKEPVVDESRLNFNMIGNVNNGAEAETENKNQPENQNGKRDGPKRSTESVYSQSLLESKMKEPTKLYMNSLNKLKEKIISDTISKYYREQNIKNASKWINISEAMEEETRKSLSVYGINIFSSGLNEAISTYESNSNIQKDNISDLIKSFINENQLNFQKRLLQVLESRLNVVESESEIPIAIESIFSVMKTQAKEMLKEDYSRFYNYGYCLGLIQEEDTEALIVNEDNVESTILLSNLSNMDDMHLIYHNSLVNYQFNRKQEVSSDVYPERA